MSSDKVKVAVRVRPFNRREIDLGTKCVVDMDPTQTMLYHPSSGTPSKDGENAGGKKAPKTFAFDHCFWSMEDNNPKFSGQEKVFQCLGQDILERAFEGYNACIFAYGQTGSGKTYTMMGGASDRGIIPRLCDGLFAQIAEITNDSHSCKVEVSYMEIYNEKVHDLLDPKGGKHNLRVREHNILGPYVDGLSLLVVNSFEDVINLMSEGNKSRTVAATNMNNESSRSHAVFNLIVTQTLLDLQSGVSGEKVSKVSLVDLAGSERAQKTGAVGERLKEGSNINKSLTTLGLVISALADQGAAKAGKKHFVPYRDSVLTWLLKDNLGGNSKTVMVATLSPAADNYEETLSTLRYADRAKRIVQHAVVNEDPNARIIRELREEVDVLKKQLDQAQSMKADTLKERLEESEKLVKELTKTWEEKLAETERIHSDRHKALEQMGISVQTSGIKVEQGKYFLVNLNADPSLNELLVYYLKERTLVGKHDAPVQQDIQLSGLGISPQHCVVELDGTDVHITPLENSRTCVNGCTVNARTKVKHGDRILWGNNHFFRLNCPKANTPTSASGDPETPIDYDFAQQELMMKQFGDDPIQEAITAIEKQHEEEKLEALEKQRLMYERQMQMLRNQLMSPNTPSQPFPAFDFARMMSSPGTSNPNIQNKYQQWAQERNKMFKQSLAKLKEEMVKANTLVREANFLAQEMGKQTEFQVTLQIPAANLSPNRKRGTFVSEPAILVKRKSKGSQIWSMEKFENKIIDMREMYEDRKERGVPMMDQKGPPVKGDPFYESQENHNLIGVANVFLEALFYDVKLDYHVPIISQQGEVSGRLHVELSRIAGMMPERQRDSDMSSESSGESGRGGGFEILDEENGLPVGATVDCRVCIREARGLPPALSNFVFCQYTFWGYPEPIVVPPLVDPEGTNSKRNDGVSFRFDHRKEFRVGVTEEFVEHCADGALSIEVWGHRSVGFSNSMAAWEMERMQAKSRSLMDRWSELSRKIEVWVEIHELNEQGEYMPVEVLAKPEVLTGGIFQLRQGHSRRIMVRVKPVHNSGTLPIICETITHVSIGCVCARSKLQKGLDSYQEEDLNTLRDKWSDALSKRRDYLDEQLQKLMNKEGEKTETDIEREKSLIDQWVGLTEERNAVLVPAAGSGIPGAPADWDPDMGMEEHIPVLFLDLNADDMSTPNAKEGLQAAGMNSILPKEHGTKFYTLPFVKTSEKDVCAVVSWDSSIHDSVHLNRVTPSNERVYLILKTVVRLSHPASMELVLRKRICINVYKKQSLTDKLKKRISKVDMQFATGVTYEVVSNIPKASEDLEDRESLAQLAASQNEADATADGETYIEKYIKGVSAVESILTLDKLRQEVAIKELLAKSGRPLRKATSVPNIHNIISPNSRLDDQMLRADSIQDLSNRDDQIAKMQKRYSLDISLRNRANSDNGLTKDISPQGKVPGFSLTSPKSAVSPQPGKLVKPMKTLIEEQHIRESKPLLDQNDESDDDLSPLKSPEKSPERECASPSSDDFQEFESYQPMPDNTSATMATSAPQKIPMTTTRTDSITHSSTSDSLADVPVKNFTPSMTSSGYDSQAVSTQTLSSEDSASVRSMSIEEVHDDSRNKSLDKSDSSSDHENDHAAVNASANQKEDAAVSQGETVEQQNQVAAAAHNSVQSSENEHEGHSSISTEVSHRSGRDLPNDLQLQNTVCDNESSRAADSVLSPMDMDVPSDVDHPVLVPAAVPAAPAGQSVNPSSDLPGAPAEQSVNPNSDLTICPVESSQNEDSTAANTEKLDSDKSTAVETAVDQLQGQNEQLSAVTESAAEVAVDSVAVKDNESVKPSDEVTAAELTNCIMSSTVSSPDDEQPEGHSTKDEVVDLYSETAMEELEKLGDGPAEDSKVLSPEQKPVVQENSAVNKNMAGKNRPKKSSNAHSEERDKFEDKPRRNNSFNDKVRRRSVDDKEKEMRKSSSTDDMSRNEVKMRKTATLEASRPVTLRKMRSGDRGGKTAPSPVKATYRPVSMPVEMVMALSSGEIDIMQTADGNNSDDDAMSVCSFGSRADLNRLGEAPVPGWLQVGEPVLVLSSQGGPTKAGTVMFVGTTEFAAGNWIGVELDTPDGKNDGSVKGIRYFKCRNRHGIFVRHDKLIMDKKRGGRKVRNVPSTLRRSTGNLTTTNARSREVLSSSNQTGSFMKPTSASSAKSK